jgi:hypothetical protein
VRWLRCAGLREAIFAVSYGIGAVAVAVVLVCVAQLLGLTQAGGPTEERSATAHTFGRCGPQRRMDCHGAESCGVLVVETGRGHGFYRHASPSVHGLWPQTCDRDGCFGNSLCIRPRSLDVLQSFLPECYDTAEARKDSSTLAHQVRFVAHEWKRHGTCSGTRDEQDFFAQVSALAPKLSV